MKIGRTEKCWLAAVFFFWVFYNFPGFPAYGNETACIVHGLISFIGLIAPHMVRQVTGNNHAVLIPGSMLAGATLLLLGDLVARTAASPILLPIGAITSLLGGPLFLYLLFKGKK